MTDPNEIKARELRSIVRAFAASDLQELDLVIGATRVQASKRAAELPPEGPPKVPKATALTPADVAPAEGAPAGAEVRSPVLGLLRRRPAPDRPPVEVGTTVRPGDPIAGVDVLGVHHVVVAAVAGTVVEICIEEGALVEYGDVVARIAPE